MNLNDAHFILIDEKKNFLLQTNILWKDRYIEERCLIFAQILVVAKKKLI